MDNRHCGKWIVVYLMAVTSCLRATDDCSALPCYHGGTCVTVAGSSECVCTEDYVGPRCEGAVRHCVHSDPCLNGAVCEDIHDGGYQCYCQPGYYGNLCQHAINECASSPCQHEGTCLDDVNSYTCICPKGYQGEYCETEDNRGCVSSPCLHGGTCIPMTTSGQYSCTCRPGYTGQWCEVDINDCSGQLCEPYQECIDLPAGYRCECPAGMTGDVCDVTLDACMSSPCQHEATCIQEADRFTCLCSQGYRGVYCEVQVDPCYPDPCLHGATCQTDTSTGAGYQCRCPAGFVGNQCEGKILQCDLPPSSEGVTASYQSGTCYNGGSCVDNLYEAGFTCSCTDQYTGHQCETRLDGCLITACEHSGTCQHTAEGHVCQCVSGWSGTVCSEDVNECTRQPCQHSGTCVNLPGSFLCLCDRYWSGVTCHVDVTECDMSPCHHGGSCVENIGAPPRCVCTEGTTGAFCESVLDACGSQPCVNNGTCVESPELEAGYQCLCPPEVTGINCEVKLDDSCQADPCASGATCVQDRDGYRCLCPPQFTGVHCSVVMDPCSSAPCLYNSTCSSPDNNTIVCECLPGYQGNTCEIVTMATFDGFSLVQLPPLTANQKRKKRSTDIMQAKALFGHGIEQGLGITELSTGGSAKQTLSNLVFKITDNKMKMSFNTRFRRESDPEVNISFTFKTTVLDGTLLLAYGKSPDDGKERHLLVQLYQGRLFVSQHLAGDAVANEIPLSDDITHVVTIAITTSHTNISLAGCSGGVDNVCHVTLKPNLNSQEISLNAGLWLGGLGHVTPYLRSRLKTTAGFTGCINDFSINGKQTSLLPDRDTNSVMDKSDLPMPGCRSHDLCTDHMTCQNGGQCVDLWTRAYCSCQDGYTGSDCGVQIGAQFSADALLHLGLETDVLDLQLDISVNTTSGTILYTVDGDPVSLYLSSGQLIFHLVTPSNSDDVIVTCGYLATGDWFHVHVQIIQDVYRITVTQGEGVTGSEQGILEDVLQVRSPVFLGVLHEHPALDTWRQRLETVTSTGFTGCIQNLSINNMTLDLSTASESIFSNDPPPAIPGCSRDRKCLQLPCQHGGRCIGGWNEYHCDCPHSFTGTDCQKAESATFNGESSYLEMSVNMTSVPFGSLGSFAFRTRDQTATLMLMLLYAPDTTRSETSLEFSLYRGTLQVVLSQPALTGGKLTFPENVADAAWHTVTWSRSHDLFTVDLGSRSQTLSAQFDPYMHGETASVYVAAKPFQLSNPSLMVGHMTGCITNVTFNNIVIPILDDEKVPGVTMNRNDVMSGCLGNNLCEAEGCHGNAVCENMWNAKICTCMDGWTGSFCNESINECVDHLCLHGSCIDGHLNYTCSCEVGYTGVNCDLAYNPCESDVCSANGTSNCVFIFPGDYQCICMEGWTGHLCEVEINECESSPCIHGECRDTTNGYICDCTGDYVGVRCDQVDICSTVICYNGGTCGSNDNNTDFLCHCLDQFSGKQCQMYDFCFGNLCENSATCVSSSVGYRCQCGPGYYGVYCEFTDFCLHEPCFNGGTCQNEGDTFQCQCGQHFTGSNCETRIDRCEPLNNLCKNGATCISNLTSEVGFTCVCVEGLTGEFCQTDIHECDSNPCQNEAACIDSHVTPWRYFPGFHCECLPGYYGDLCEHEINECESSPCKNNGSCHNFKNEFQCQCLDGFEGTSCDRDIRLCTSDPCENEAQCVEQEDETYSCVCQVGYSGKLCSVNIDDCINNECVNGATCLDSINSYSCECLPGYSGKYCDGIVDACFSQPCKHGGSCHYQGLCSCKEIVTSCGWHNETCQEVSCQQTENCVLNGSPYICDCIDTGYAGLTCEQDVDECVEEALACEHGGVCSNTLASYTCDCRGTGYTGARCDLDIDECTGPNPCFNDGQCENFSGSYSCQCPAGWTGVTCGQLVDHCTDLSCRHGGTCINTQTGFVCDCSHTGYEGPSCEVNINDCADDLCLNSGRCVDGIKMFTCDCSNTGYHGDRCQNEVDDCAESPCLNNATCRDIGPGFECTCNKGFTGTRCHVDVNECLASTHECQQGATCVNTVGSYSCLCPLSLTGRLCEQAVSQASNESSSTSSTGVIIACVLILLAILVALAMYAVWHLRLARRKRGRYKPATVERSLNSVSGGIPLEKMVLPGQQERLV